MRLIWPIAVLLSLLGSTAAGAVTLTPVGSFEEPTYIASEPDPDRLLVTERRGTIELVQGGQVSLFSDLSSLVGCPAGCAGERGLMSLAVAPDFASSGHLYVDYIDNASGQIHVDQLTATGASAPLATRQPILTIAHSDAANHNGGQLQFGPDGYLYVSTGDGGGGNDQFHHSQDPNSPLGKLLRVDPQQANPTATVWSLGLRNPFRFSFDRLSGDLAIADVGQDAREEVDFAPRTPLGGVGGQGTNWGWNCREGLIAGPADDLPPGQCATAFAAGAFADPVFDYPHTGTAGSAHGCAIIGGYVARDESLGDLYGRYLYTDLCNGDLRSLELPATGAGQAGGDRSEGVSVSEPVSFGEDSCRRLYVVAGGGEISRLDGAARAECPAPEPPPAMPPPSVPSPIVPSPGPSPMATRVRLRADRALVEPGTRASLTVHVSPCAGRGPQRVTLRRGGRQIATGRLDADCAVRFEPPVERRSTFRALVPATAEYLEGRSARVTVSTLPGPSGA